MIAKKILYQEEVAIKIEEKIVLLGTLTLPQETHGIVLFVHGSGSSRLSSRNQFVAHYLQEEGLGTLLFDLLTQEEEILDENTRQWRFNIPLLTSRLIKVTDWLSTFPKAKSCTLGYFGASTGAAAALIGAAEKGAVIRAVVSRGGRPDLAGNALLRVQSPTLLIVGGNDFGVIELNEQAYNLLNCTKKLEIVSHATHLFEEEGALDEVGRLAAHWFNAHL